MAASSPALNNNSTGTPPSLHRTDTPPKTLRGLNKPKCIQCGNVARSRCPYQSCKSCCSKAQNPCHIHVLKANATFADKTPTSTSALHEQKSTDTSPAGNSLRVASLRQLSNNFAQFNNVQISSRSRKPLTRKDVATINEWRFSKIKEYRDRNIEVENEAFERYMQNVSLLEEVFTNKSILEGPTEGESPISSPNSTSVEEDGRTVISGLKLKPRSNSTRNDNFRIRIQQIVDQGLEKLKKHELHEEIKDQNVQDEIEKSPKKPKLWWSERASALNDLIDKVNKARGEDDPKILLKLKSQLNDKHTSSSQVESKDAVTKEQTLKCDSALKNESGYLFHKLFITSEIDQDSLKSVATHFTSLERIQDL